MVRSKAGIKKTGEPNKARIKNAGNKTAAKARFGTAEQAAYCKLDSFFHLHKARCSVALSERTPSIRPSQGRGGPLHAIFVASGITHQVRPNSLHRKVTVPTSHYTARHEWVLLSIHTV